MMRIYDDFENLLNEFEHACRGGDYEISKQLKKQIVQLLDSEEEKTADVLADLCKKIDWLTQELERQKSFWMRKYVNEKEKAERYEKVLKTIAEHEYCGSIGATGYYAEFKSMAKNALEVTEQ